MIYDLSLFGNLLSFLKENIYNIYSSIIMSFSKFNLKTIPDLKKFVANYFTRPTTYLEKNTIFNLF